MAYLTTIQGPTHPKAKAGFLGTLCILQVASIVTLLAIILAQCSPIEKLWDEALPGTCNGIIRNRQFGFFQGGEWPLHPMAKGQRYNQVLLRACCSYRHLFGYLSCGNLLDIEAEVYEESGSKYSLRMWNCVRLFFTHGPLILCWPIRITPFSERPFAPLSRQSTFTGLVRTTTSRVSSRG